MDVDRIATRTLLPGLLVALAVAGYFAFGTVETVELDRGGAPALPPLPIPEPLPPPALRDGRLSVGEQLASLAELEQRQQRLGFVRVGRFGSAWPARIVEIAEDRDGIRFVRGDGTPHSYREFDGYRMQMVRLKRGGEETIVVFRARNKSS